MNAFAMLGLMAGTLVRGVLILGIALLGVRLLRQGSAAGRYAVWAAAFGSLVLLPVLTTVLPVLDLPATGLDRPAQISAPLLTHPVVTDARRDISPHPSGPPQMAGGPSAFEAGGVRPTAATRRSDLMVRGRDLGRRSAPWLLTAWLGGALLVLTRLARDVQRIARVTQRATPVRRGPLADLGREIATDLGIRQTVRLALTRELALPVTWGLWWPVVLLPTEARSWGAERRRVVLRHELAHVRRHDYAGHLLIELGCAVHWPNAYAWRAARRARLEQEQACDDRVLALGTGAIDYAQQLLDLVRTPARPLPSRGALAMAAAATLPGRMRSILDQRLDHRPANRRTLTVVGAAALLVGIPTATLHPWSVGPSERELVAQLQAADPLVRRQAVWALAGRESAAARSALVAGLHAADPATRGVAAWGLGKLGDRAALGSLIAALRDNDAQVREMAVLALGDLRDPRAIPALEPLARDPEHGVRSVMTIALRDIRGDAAAAALGRLLRSDADPHTRVMAAAALTHFESASRIASLEGGLRDTMSEVRSAAAWSLEEVGSRHSVAALLAALARESDPDAGKAIVHALGATRDPGAVDGLVGALGAEASRIRESASHVLGVLGDVRAVPALMAATRDPDHEVRLTAVWALDALQQGR